MSKYAADMELGFYRRVFEADSPDGIVREMEKLQDFGCILMMGRAHEPPEFQFMLDMLEEFLKKYMDGKLTMKDIANLSIILSIGNIICHEIAEGEEAVEKLKAKKR